MPETKQQKYSHLWRGIKGVCPKCGQGKLFQSYLKQNQKCPHCQEDFSNIHADDAPSWLTILVTGHIVAPLAIFFAKHNYFPDHIEVAVMASVIFLLILFILPRAKGLFIATIWHAQKKD